jgi:iron complex outermembrane receptor protein
VIFRHPLATTCAVSVLALSAGAPAAFAAEAPAKPESEPSSVSELVVTAEHRVEVGEAVGDIRPDIQLGPQDIQSYGVTAITDLLDQLAPDIRSDSGRGGEPPAILINGHRISDFREIRNLPTEALLRVDILPEEAALKYGFSANQRVINFVLKPRYGSRVVDVTGGASTAGGAAGGQASFTATQIAGDNRLILNAKYNPQASLTEAERQIIPLTAGQTFDLVGNVTPATPDGEIDPALSALAGRPIAIAGVPAAAAAAAPSLAAFLPTAGIPNATDVRRFRTLLADTRKISGDVTFTRPVFADINATLNGTFEASTSDSLRGLAGVRLLVPAGDPFSPFSTPVQVNRLVDGFGPLGQSADTWQAHLGVSFNKQVGNWRLALTGNYDQADSKNANDTGLDATALQAQLTARAPGLNPFGPLPANLLTLRSQDTSRSKSDSGNMQFIAAGPILSLPAGKVFSSFRIGANGSEFISDSLRFGIGQTSLSTRADFTRSGGNAQVSVDVPITSTRNNILAKFGDTSVNVHGAVQQASDFGTLTSYGYGLNWRPFTGLNVLVSQDYDQGAPSQSQLGAPLLRTPGTRIFDFATGQTVDVIQVSGGNPTLIQDNRERTKVTVNWRPLPTTSKQQLSIRADYNRIHIRNPIETFPAATAAIEAAFPDRFVRDAGGELTEIDNRPVNFSSADTSELRYGLDFSMPIGPVTVARARGPAAMLRGRTMGGGPPEGGGDSGPGGGAGGGPGADGGPPPTMAFSGPPGGGRGPGGGGGGPGQPQQDGRFRLAIFHTIHFENQQLVRTGGPLLDFLNGAALGSGGGQPQQELDVQLNVFERGYGAELSGAWKSGSSVRGGAGPASDLDFSSLATVRARIFVELDQRKTLIEKAPWLKGTRLSFSVNNLFDQRLSIHDGTGATPLSFQPFYVDPIGRTWRVGLHKVFQ